jgi:NADH-quinone oxidoreductase subunit C
MLNNETVQQQITEKFGSQVYGFEAPYGMLTFEADRDSNIKILQYLKDDLGFTFLNDLTAVHYPDNIGKELAVVYMLQNIQHSLRIRFKVYTDITKPDV